MIVGPLIARALVEARNRDSEPDQRWISSGHRLAARRGVPMLSYDVAVVGRLDSVLRAMGFESLQPGRPEDPDEDVWTQDIHASWSRLWVLAAYECVRAAAQRATGDRSTFEHLRDRMGLVRIPLAKAEIAKDKKYLGNGALNLGRVGDPPDAPSRPL